MRQKYLLLLFIILGILLSFFFYHCDRKTTALPTNSQRIICMAPNIVEIIFALEQGSRVAAVSDFCIYPDAALKKPKIGGYINPNLEKITALTPDLVMVSGLHPQVSQFCRQKGIWLIHIETSNLMSIYDNIDYLGQVLQCAEKAHLLQQDIQRHLQQIEEQARRQKPVKTFICISRSMGTMGGLTTCGKGYFLHDLLEIAGGINVFPNADPRFEVSTESLAARSPDAIIDMYPGQELTQEARSRIIADWQRIPGLQDKAIHILQEDYLLIPGPRVAQIAGKFFEVLH